MNFASILTGAVVLSALLCAIYVMTNKNNKNGCSGSCGGCAFSASCSRKDEERKAADENK